MNSENPKSVFDGVQVIYCCHKKFNGAVLIFTPVLNPTQIGKSYFSESLLSDLQSFYELAISNSPNLIKTFRATSTNACRYSARSLLLIAFYIVYTSIHPAS